LRANSKSSRHSDHSEANTYYLGYGGVSKFKYRTVFDDDVRQDLFILTLGVNTLDNRYMECIMYDIRRS
jgi:hypothetical protein